MGGMEGEGKEWAHVEPCLCHKEEFSSGDTCQVNKKQFCKETGKICQDCGKQ